MPAILEGCYANALDFMFQVQQAQSCSSPHPATTTSRHVPTTSRHYVSPFRPYLLSLSTTSLWRFFSRQAVDRAWWAFGGFGYGGPFLVSLFCAQRWPSFSSERWSPLFAAGAVRLEDRGGRSSYAELLQLAALLLSNMALQTLRKGTFLDFFLWCGAYERWWGEGAEQLR